MNLRAGYHRTIEGRRERVVSETRASRVSIDRRADGPSMIRGYAAVYYRDGDESTEYWLWDDMVERIMPGAFDDVLKDDVRALFNHNPDNLLGRTIAGTARISADATGLAYQVDEDPDDPDWKRVARKIDRGDLTGSSFAFIPKRIVWVEEDNYAIRQIEKMELLVDVGPVTYPAYAGSTTGRDQTHQIYDQMNREREQFFRSQIDRKNEIELIKLRARRTLL